MNLHFRAIPLAEALAVVGVTMSDVGRLVIPLPWAWWQLRALGTVCD